ARPELDTLSLHDALPICYAWATIADASAELSRTSGQGPAAERRDDARGRVPVEIDVGLRDLFDVCIDDAIRGARPVVSGRVVRRSEEHTSELQSPDHLVC